VKALNDCLQLKLVTRTFDDLSSSRFLEKLSLCKHSILSLSFANDDFDHGRESQSLIVIRSYTISMIVSAFPFPFSASDTTTDTTIV
jgi:hypothetical protein